MLPAPTALHAQLTANMSATLSDVVPLWYRTSYPGLPAHVRSASALRRWRDRLVIVQDDVHAFALLDQHGQVEPLVLPGAEDGVLLFDDAHGNKRSKLDLESALCLPDGRLLAFGSGATERRERIVVLGKDSAARLVDAAALYRVLRANQAFAAEELNIEGVVLAGETIRFFQRATGTRAAVQMSASAIGDISLNGFLDWLDRGGAVPQLTMVNQVDLGDINGIRFGFTDAAMTLDGSIAFLACAEDSSDAVSDGPVLGCRFGLIAGTGVVMTDVVDTAGQCITLKLEGLESRPGDPSCFDAVADQDQPDEPALLAQLRITLA